MAKDPASKVSTRLRREAKVGKAKHGKRLTALLKSVDPLELHTPEDAIAKVKANANAKFDETVEASIMLGVDPRHGDQMVRGTVNLPHGTGKSRKVAVFAKGEKAEAAKAAGADEVGAEDLVERIQKGWDGWTSFDIFVASPDMMAGVGRIGSILKQKMPNPKAGTVTQDVAKVVKEIKGATRAEYRVEKAGIIHAPIGKASFSEDQIKENLLVLVNALVKAKPATSKGRYLKKIALSSTMGPSVLLDTVITQKSSDKI
jgi:large subunit ribosomal protein L1